MTLAILAVTVFAASTLSGVLGMGGGIFLLAVMASLLDPVAVVPVHGVVQLTSNVTRTVRLVRDVNWRFFALYVPILGLGAFVATRFYRGADAPWFRPAIGWFVLAFLVWDRFKPKRIKVPNWALVPAGFVGGMLTVLVGATGPYLAAFFLRDDMDRHEIVATKAAIQTVGHLVKIPAFFVIGFDYAEHLPLLLPLLACAIAGTVAGTSILSKLSEKWFRRAFRVFLAVMAVRLILFGES
jgi:uncharacterized membrane protein YfcA